jgi:hypothetical protein
VANLKSICEQSWHQIYPNGSDEATITREEFLATGRNMYAYQMLLLYWTERQREGEFLIPSHLLSETEIEIIDNKMDISSLNVFRSLPSDVWLQNIGGILCECKYVKSSVNMTQLMCGDDSLGEARRYIPVSKKILFPDGVHKSPLTIIYANMGETTDMSIEVDDALGAIVREKLVELYLGKIGQENKTNDTNPNQ